MKTTKSLYVPRQARVIVHISWSEALAAVEDMASESNKKVLFSLRDAERLEEAATDIRKLIGKSK